MTIKQNSHFLSFHITSKTNKHKILYIIGGFLCTIIMV